MQCPLLQQKCLRFKFFISILCFYYLDYLKIDCSYYFSIAVIFYNRTPLFALACCMDKGIVQSESQSRKSQEDVIPTWMNLFVWQLLMSRSPFTQDGQRWGLCPAAGLLCVTCSASPVTG